MKPRKSRNSYAKTDPDATFMRMKEDHMRNVQFAVNSGYITGVGAFSDRADCATLPPLLDTLAKAKDARKQKEIVLCWEMADCRAASLERISTEEGVLLRVNRSIQSEGSFAQLKHNRSFKRFLTGVRSKYCRNCTCWLCHRTL